MVIRIARWFLPWASLMVFLPVFFAGSNLAHGAGALSKDLDSGRADMIVIDSAGAFGKRERPAVLFFHDKHTKAVEAKGEGCRLCHPVDGNYQSLKFKRQEDRGKEALMDLYHTGCIGCHRDTAAERDESGPVECGGCHRKHVPVAASWREIDFDKSLHYRHVKAKENQCGACHHAYDASSKKLYHDKGKEGSCRYCHMTQAEENRVSIADASHLSCIGCHKKTGDENKKAGPVKCSGCHELAAQQNIEKVLDVPRMSRNQPDAVLIKIPDESEKGVDPPGGRMGQVPFDHRGHEAGNASCRNCHHKALSACGTCHTFSGTKDGGWVSFEQAMHKKDADESCLGCHLSRTLDRDCAGCHASIEEKAFTGRESCTPCHLSLEKAGSGEEADPGAGQEPEEEGLVSRLLAVRKGVVHTFSDEEIPDKVTIRSLAEKYRPVEMPHRKIVHALIENIQGSRLVEYFHRQRETVCQGCHHGSPPGLKPARCGNCHGERAFEGGDLFRPALIGAYHIQCMGCHKTMGIEKPAGCTECHVEK